jgi:hypothetical protein
MYDLTFKNVFFFTATTVARATPTTTAATTATATEQAEIGRIFGNYFFSFHSLFQLLQTMFLTFLYNKVTA